mmetsp:Transcript_1181/g.3124  ORF Transcript_1181/g.3124 Transcript_1181/m.3124 type:complete len:374 (-) Transcript_1181:246-1367(-)|eukprot:CAMPEP_0119121692 /NCGR_PEP_ID=MMETSP1310-20130426/2202_1 /TAXON_ID=464262 /ORGANISM="Genus nov. species nov., Strain RCC2339" /LENGTH=373 /DNA_ID=CAMNT_0007111267 /DNA_START=89 /DNA_END=1210 /DNA_ORIENTATION=+
MAGGLEKFQSALEEGHKKGKAEAEAEIQKAASEAAMEMNVATREFLKRKVRLRCLTNAMKEAHSLVDGVDTPDVQKLLLFAVYFAVERLSKWAKGSAPEVTKACDALAKLLRAVKDKGADLNAPLADEDAPMPALFVAMQYRSAPLVEALLLAGADAHLRHTVKVRGEPTDFNALQYLFHEKPEPPSSRLRENRLEPFSACARIAARHGLPVDFEVDLGSDGRLPVFSYLAGTNLHGTITALAMGVREAAAGSDESLRDAEVALRVELNAASSTAAASVYRRSKRLRAGFFSGDLGALNWSQSLRPVQVAAMCNSIDALDALLAAGADPAVVSDDGLTLSQFVRLYTRNANMDHPARYLMLGIVANYSSLPSS